MMRAAMILTVMLGCIGCQLDPVRPGLDAEALGASKRVMEAGTESLQKKDYAEATRYYQLAYQLGKQAEALDGLGCVAFAQGDLTLAAARFSEAIERYPSLSEAYGHLGAVLEQRGSVVEAERYFQQGLAIKPSDVTLRFEYAQFLSRNGRSKDAKILINQVRSMLPKTLIPKTINFRLNRG